MTICIGRPIIQILAQDGAYQSKSGEAVVAADDLFHNDPYAEIARLEEALQRIEQWARAYPLAIFPKPDLKRAHKLLQAGGMTLDAISAHAMRHVVEGVGDIARRALEHKP